MSKEEIVEEFIKWFENYGVIIPDGSSATIKDFMVDSEIQLMAEELYEDFFVDLESELAEKERQLNLSEELLIKQEKEYDEQLEKQAKIHYRHLKEKDQDKILFALEQLEKVKEFFLEEHRDEEMDTDYIITKDAGEIADYLLDQIKQLKGGK